MFRSRQVDIITDVAAINDAAREARRICTDIVRQTSAKPYYGKKGGAAFYAPEDESEKQLRRIKEALRLLRRANGVLRHAAVSGGVVEAAIQAEMKQDYLQTKVTILPDAEDTAGSGV